MKYYYEGDLKVIARELRKQMTKQERHLWYDFLKSYQYQFYRQRIIDRFIADFYCPAAKLVIELDGGQHYDDIMMVEDKQRTSIIKQYGVDVIRIPNNEVDSNFYNVCTYLYNIIKERIEGNSSVRNLL